MSVLLIFNNWCPLLPSRCVADRVQGFICTRTQLLQLLWIFQELNNRLNKAPLVIQRNQLTIHTRLDHASWAVQVIVADDWYPVAQCFSHCQRLGIDPTSIDE